MTTTTEYRVSYRTTDGKNVHHRATTDDERTACALANLLSANVHTESAWVEKRHVTYSATEWAEHYAAPRVPHRAGQLSEQAFLGELPEAV